MGPGLDGYVFALCVYQGDVVAGGWFTPSDGRPGYAAARWDGSAWQPLPSGPDDGIYAFTGWNGALIAGGWFDHAGGVEATRLAAWDGEQWAPVGGGIEIHDISW